jgi:hypothetical protein
VKKVPQLSDSAANVTVLGAEVSWRAVAEHREGSRGVTLFWGPSKPLGHTLQTVQNGDLHRTFSGEAFCLNAADSFGAVDDWWMEVTPMGSTEAATRP